jgi:hypothetical protein
MCYTRTHGWYIGYVSHGFVVGLLKVSAYTRFACVVCAGKPMLTEVDAPPPPGVRYASSRKKLWITMDVLLRYGELAST